MAVTSISINSEPKGAAIYIDKKSAHAKTPAEVEVLAGTHKIVLVLEGYEDYLATVSVTSGTTKLVRYTLKKGKSTAEPEVPIKPEDSPFVKAFKNMTAAFKSGDLTGAARNLLTLPFASMISEDIKVSENIFPITAVAGAAGVAGGAAEAATLAAKNTGWIAWALKNWRWLTGAIVGIASTSTFVNFLYEEALQTAGMGVWVQISNKNWNEAAIQLQKARGFLDTADFFYKYTGWVNPLTWKVFRNYAEATKAQYDSYEAAIRKAGGVFPNPSTDGKVFDKTKWAQNLSTGKTEFISTLVTPEIKDLTRTEEVTGITDGDTFQVGTKEKVRIASIDAPEFTTAEGKVATQKLRDLIYRKRVTLSIEGGKELDVYGRTLAVVKIGNIDIGLEMIKSGNATFYPANINKFVNETVYLAAETAAKAVPVVPVVPEVPAEIVKITASDLFKEMKTYYVDRLYMSKKELDALLAKYDTSEIQAFVDEVWSYYVGRMYLSKKEMITLGRKYNFDISGL